jgi:HSP20 family protein
MVPFAWAPTPQAQPADGWQPAVDLYETPDAFVLAVEVIAVALEDLDVHADGQALTVQGRGPGGRVRPGRYLQVERAQGAFTRTFRFAHPIDAGRIAAHLQDGVLTVTVPKVRPHEPRRVAIE